MANKLHHNKLDFNAPMLLAMHFLLR